MNAPVFAAKAESCQLNDTIDAYFTRRSCFGFCFLGHGFNWAVNELKKKGL
jgi:hypothetical protein